jgi:hypothetical protein
MAADRPQLSVEADESDARGVRRRRVDCRLLAVQRRRQTLPNANGSQVRLDLRQNGGTPRQAVDRPVLLPIVVFGNRWLAWWNDDPRLLACCEYVDVRWKTIRIVERPYADESDYRAGPGIVAPDSDPAPRTPSDLLPAPAVGWSVDDLRFARQVQNAVRLDHRIQCERCSALALAPTTMATMHEQRSRCHAIPDQLAVTSTIHWKRVLG